MNSGKIGASGRPDGRKSKALLEVHANLKSKEEKTKREDKKRKNEKEMRSYTVAHGNTLQKGRYFTH